MRRQIVLLLVLLIVSCNANLQWRCTIKSCTKSGAKMQNIDTYFYPNPPVIGKPLTLYLNGVLSEKVTDGQLYMEANIDHSPPFKESYELCYIMLSELNTECPLLPGEVHYEYATKIPNLMPPGNYSAMVRTTDQNYNELFCLQAKCSVGPTVDA